MIINREGLSNYHTHTIYCDGNNTVNEMVDKAISLGFKTLGFSGHQYSDSEYYYAMSIEAMEEYIKDIRAAEEEYGKRGEKLKIHSGIERDFFADRIDEKYDYVIGSVHSVKAGDGHLFVDSSVEKLRKGVEEYFDGDYLKLAKAFFELERGVAEKTGCHIIGHFDLFRKFNEGNVLFDEERPEFISMGMEALHDVIENFDVNKVCLPPKGRKLPEEIERALDSGKPIFEINTGAMAKGHRTTPYPSKPLIDELIKMDIPILMNSDCHNKDYLNYGFDYVKKMI